MSKLQKWQLLQAEDVSPSPFFPLERRTYKTPDGRVVEDFYVCTLEDSVHVVPITPEGNVVLIRMYKQGADDIVLQFPAGRLEKKHASPQVAAAWELEEEAGIKVDPSDLEFVQKMAVMTTKSTENVWVYVAKNAVFNSKQNFDENEEIETVVVSPAELDQMILDGKIVEGLIIADWYLVKEKFATWLSST